MLYAEDRLLVIGEAAAVNVGDAPPELLYHFSWPLFSPMARIWRSQGKQRRGD
jgi:hypothetical protein